MYVIDIVLNMIVIALYIIYNNRNQQNANNIMILQLYEILLFITKELLLIFIMYLLNLLA